MSESSLKRHLSSTRFNISLVCSEALSGGFLGPSRALPRAPLHIKLRESARVRAWASPSAQPAYIPAALLKMPPAVLRPGTSSWEPRTFAQRPSPPTAPGLRRRLGRRFSLAPGGSSFTRITKGLWASSLLLPQTSENRSEAWPREWRLRGAET